MIKRTLKPSNLLTLIKRLVNSNLFAPGISSVLGTKPPQLMKNEAAPHEMRKVVNWSPLGNNRGDHAAIYPLQEGALSGRLMPPSACSRTAFCLHFFEKDLPFWSSTRSF